MIDRPGRRGGGLTLLVAALALFSAPLLRPAPARSADRFTIDRYLNIRSASSPRLATDQRHVAFLTNITGTNQIWRVPIEGGWPDQLTAFEERVTGFAYAPNDNRIAFLRDTGGNEQGQIYLLSADGADITPLVTEEGVTHYFGAWSWDGTKISYSSNSRDRSVFDPYVLDVATGQSRRLMDAEVTTTAAGFSADDRKLMLSRQISNLENALFACDLASGTITPLSPPEPVARFASAQWSKDGRYVYCASDRDREYVNLARVEVATGKFEWVEERNWDSEGLGQSFDGRRWVSLTNVDGATEVRLYDGPPVTGTPVAPPDVPRGLLSSVQFSRDNSTVVFSLNSPTTPSDVFTWKPATKELKRITWSSTNGIPAETFVAPELVRYRSFDGLEIPGFLYRPQGLRSGEKVPCLLSMHGGPESQERASYSGLLQYYLQRGYAIFAPNVRGSTGYGKTYHHMDDIEKREDSVKDMAAAVDYLKSTGWIDGDRVAVIGGSYGGYMVLAGLTLYPDLFAAGVNTVGIANFVTFLEKTASYRRYLREVEYGDLDRDREFLERVSPLHKADRIRSPLLVIQGANDPRVPAYEAEQIVTAVKANGGEVEYLLYEDEGHGLSKLKNRIDAYPKVADFLDRFVKNRMSTKPRG
jgi:dipeptidyl aminopeptidase/acylaminoacyl peptidase